MSPARSKRTPIPHRRSRADIVRAAGVAAGIVLATALVIWLMRPGPAGVPGTGGLINRQPRSSWLILLSLGLAAGTAWWILRVSRKARGHVKVVLPTALGAVAVAAVVGGIAWPGGLLRHDRAPAPIKPTPSSVPAATTTGATSTSTSTTTGAASTTTTPTTGSSTTAGP